MTALTAVDRRLLADKIDGRLVAWIHDELIVEAREADVDRVKAILQHEMERAFVATFPTATLRDLIEVKVASNWAGDQSQAEERRRAMRTVRVDKNREAEVPTTWVEGERMLTHALGAYYDGRGKNLARLSVAAASLTGFSAKSF